MEEKALSGGIIHGQLQMFYILIFMLAADRGTIIMLLRFPKEDTIKGQPSTGKEIENPSLWKSEMGSIEIMRIVSSLSYDVGLILYLLKNSLNLLRSLILREKHSQEGRASLDFLEGVSGALNVLEQNEEHKSRLPK